MSALGEEFYGIDLGDRRLNRRARRLLEPVSVKVVVASIMLRLRPVVSSGRSVCPD